MFQCWTPKCYISTQYPWTSYFDTGPLDVRYQYRTPKTCITRGPQNVIYQHNTPGLHILTQGLWTSDINTAPLEHVSMVDPKMLYSITCIQTPRKGSNENGLLQQVVS